MALIDGEEYDLDDETPEPARQSAPKKSTGRPPGRPRGSGRKGTETTIIKRELTGEEDPDDLQTFSALFAVPEGDGGIVRVRVISRDPDEGSLGYIDDLDASEDVLREKWGARTYVLQGIDATHRIRKSMQVKVGGGDPIFNSEVAEAKWRRAHGLASTRTNGAAMSPIELMKVIEERDEKRRREEKEVRQEREEREAKVESRRREDDRTWQQQREKDARDWELRKGQMERDAEDRRRREEAERDDRRRKDDAERADRERRDRLEAEARSQAHMQQMLTMVKQSSEQAMLHMKTTAATNAVASNPTVQMMETVKMIAAVKDAFGGAAGGSDGDMDPMSMLIKSLPEMLAGVVPAIGATVREIRGGGASPPAQSLQLPPAVASKMEQLATAFAAKGIDPEAGIAALLDTAANRLAGVPAATPQAQQIASEAKTETPVSAPVAQVNTQPVQVATPATPVAAPAPVEKPVAPAPVKLASGVVRMTFATVR
ncbi:MAG: hypothetical protein ACSLEZ_15065 [Thiobacillus sp.]